MYGRFLTHLGAALLAAALVSACLAAAARANDARIVDEELLGERLVELTIETPAFTEPTKVHVFLPSGYDAHPNRRWPVTYFTAGTMNNYDSFNNLLHGEEFLAGYPSIFVSPDGNSGYWSDWYNDGAFGPPEYETYVIDQLIPLIDAHFRTIADRSGRAIFGISMGGYGSIMLAAHHPDLFAAAATLSGAVDSNIVPNGAVLSLSSTFDGAEPDAIYGPRATQEIRWRGHNPFDLAPNLRGLDLQARTANGIPNPAIGEQTLSADSVSCVVELGVYGASQNLHRKLTNLKIPHTWKDYGPGCHTIPNFRREIVDTLAGFEDVFADPPPAPKRFNYRSIEPRFEVYDWHVKADPERALEFLRMKGAGRGGLTLIGSGQTEVRTPAYFRRLDAVDLVTPDGTRTLEPNRRGHLRFSVDLGEAHPDQQYTPASRAAGGTEDGYFTSVGVGFQPHAQIKLRRPRLHHRRLRACVRARGGPIKRARISLRAGKRHAARGRNFEPPTGRACVPLRIRHVRRLQGRRVLLRARATDRFGRRATAKRRVRIPR